jgi:hypothetical protein
MKLKKQQFYSFGEAASPGYRPNPHHPEPRHIARPPPFRPYSELNLALPSKTPANLTRMRQVRLLQ